MSIEDQLEQRAYDILAEIARLPRPKERQRICLEIIKLAATVGRISLAHAPGE